MQGAKNVTFTTKQFATSELAERYIELHRELYPKLPIGAPIVSGGAIVVLKPKLLLLGRETFVEVNGRWRNVMEIS
jgi:hypothetical protein